MSKDKVRIRCDYPGGNIKINRVEENHIYLETDLRDTPRSWFYWNFCIENADNKDITFEFESEVIGVLGPSVSKDTKKWEWLGKDSVIDKKSFRYSFGKMDKAVFFSFSFPYQVKDFENFYNKFKKYPLLERKILAYSEQGRPIPLLSIGNKSAGKHIVFLCRHHACESTASYVLEGLIKYLLTNGESILTRDYLIHIIPFIDIDGVENGDQGKDRFPHDHNKDYIEKPIYNSIKAVTKYLYALDIVAGIDFHSPYKFSGRHDHPYIVKQPQPIKDNIEKFESHLIKITENSHTNGKIKFEGTYDIEMGEGWNKSDNPTCSSFLRKKGVQLCFTFEFPYCGKGEIVYTQENIRGFGSDFGKALEMYFSGTDRYEEHNMVIERTSGD